MTDPVGSKVSGGVRTYVNPSTGARYKSVTSILGMINKPAIAPWMAKKAGERAVYEFEELRAKLAHAKTKKAKEDVRKWVSGAAREHSGAAALKGSQVHDIAEKIINGEDPGPITDEQQAYVNGYLKFVEDHTPEYLFAETTFVNQTLQYAGTADFGAKLWRTWDVPVIGDWKTGATGPYLEWAYQLVAYAHGEHTLIKNPDGTLALGPMPMVSLDRAVAVRILPNRYETHWVGEHPILTMDVLWQGFKAAAVLSRIADAAAKDGPFTR